MKYQKLFTLPHQPPPRPPPVIDILTLNNIFPNILVFVFVVDQGQILPNINQKGCNFLVKGFKNKTKLIHIAGHPHRYTNFDVLK